MLKYSAVAAGAAALVAFAAPAMASPPYAVTANGVSSGDVTFSAHSDAITFTVHNSGGDRVMTCSDVTVGGVIHTGTGVNPVASITSSTWQGCAYSGLPVNVTPNHSPSWDLYGTSAATSGNTDDIDGQVRNVNANVSILSGACTFDVTGAANGTFHEASQTIDMNETAGNLVLGNRSSAIGCLNQVNNGDTADFVGTFTVTEGAPIYLS
ncbi:hypothetical protein AB3X52_12540 [Nocardioides sp. DS6]|uniref:Uncharacterized protein n=1 Tax=Nocardioides eburneus TaxID=3231482 RepID=A0ABV3SZU9_9ACTN